MVTSTIGFRGNKQTGRKDYVKANVKYAFKPKEPDPKPIETTVKDKSKHENSKKATEESSKNAQNNDLTKTANNFNVLQDQYDDEFPAISTSQNQKDKSG